MRLHRLFKPSLAMLMIGLSASSPARAAYTDVVLADGPVAYWQLDEKSDSEPPVDATGNVPTLGFGWDDRGGMSWGNPGIPGTEGTSIVFQSSAFSFGCNGACGAGSVMLDSDFQDGVLDLGNISDATPVTMEAWFTLLPGWEAASFPRLFHYNNSDGGQFTFGIVGNEVPGAFPQARTVFGGRGDGGGGSVIKSGDFDLLPSGEDVDEDQWFHLVAYSFEDEIRLWLNGEEIGDLFDADPIGWQARQATIGARIQNDLASVVQPFPGRIDELAIYNKQLTSEQILAHYQAGLGITPEPIDINSLQDAIKAGSTDSRYDVNGDGSVNLADQDAYVSGTLKTWTGDANLDGEFNSGDLVAVFTVGEYEDNDLGNPATIGNSRWEDGDWNADREFDSSDFVAAFTAGGYEMGPRAAVAAVPEPTTFGLLAWGGLMLLGRRRR